MHKALPFGLVFPFNFGFVPYTSAGDGDSLDVLLLTDYIFPVGSVLLGGLISVLRAEQTENRKKERNDRLIAVPVEMESRQPMQPVVEFNSSLRAAIVDFFTKYNELQGRKFRALGYATARGAIRTVEANTKNATAPNAPWNTRSTCGLEVVGCPDGLQRLGEMAITHSSVFPAGRRPALMEPPCEREECQVKLRTLS